MLQVKRLTQFATLPSRATQLSAGLDLCSAYHYEVPAWGKCL